MKSSAHVVRTILFAVISIYSYGTPSVLSSGNWYKISAKEEGIYILTYNDLSALGISPSSIDPRKIAIWSHRPGELPLLNNAPRPGDPQEIAIEVRGESDGSFDLTDTVFFYNKSQIDWVVDTNTNKFRHFINHYTDSTYFFLTIGSVNGKRIQDLQSLSSFTHTTNKFTEHAVHEIDSVNFFHLGEEWYGEMLDMYSNNSVVVPLRNDNYTTSDPLFITVSFAARSFVTGTAIDCHTTSGTNQSFVFGNVGTTIQDNYVAGYPFSFNAIVPTGPESLTITLNSTDTATKGWLNYIEINAVYDLVYNNVSTPFRDLRNVGSGKIVNYNLISGLPDKIWDVTDFYNVKNQQMNSGGNYSFNANADSLREYIADGTVSYHHPSLLGTVVNQDLHSMTNKNLILVSDATFYSDANALGQFHQSHDNLSYVVVTPEQIFNEYSSGQLDPVAIRDFIRQIYFSASSPNDSLHYVILFGDATFDHKDKLGYGRKGVPIYQYGNSINRLTTSWSDDFYALMDPVEGTLSGNDVIDIAIGRIPVRDQSDGAVVNKIISYVTNPSRGVWRTKYTGIADDQDYNIHFRQQDTLMNRIENFECAVNQDKIYLDEFVQILDTATGEYLYPDANTAIYNAFMYGSAVIQYTGHATPEQWANENVLSKTFLDTVTNLNNLPIVISHTAQFNRIEDPADESSGRALLMNSSGGGIASISSPGLAFSSSSYGLITHIVNNLFDHTSGEWPTLGKSYLKTKQRVTADPYVRNVGLLGDPVIHLPFPENTVAITSISTDTIDAGEAIALSGEIVDVNGNSIPSFTGTLDITFFKPKTLLHTLGNDSLNMSNPSMSVPFYEWDDTLYSTSVNVVNGVFSLSFVTPMTLDSGIGTGRIAMYGYSSTEEAMGCNQNIIYRNLISGIDEYENVVLQIYPNPATEIIHCTLSGNVKNKWTYALVSMDGKIIASDNVASNEFSVSRKNYSSGMYYLKIMDEDNRVVKASKIVFQ